MAKSIKLLLEGNFEMEHLHECGIYSIYFTAKDKFYIGSTNNKDGFVSRWRYHLYLLRKNKHTNSILLNTYNKYGEENIHFKIVEICNKDSEYILKREYFYIDSLHPYFNINRVAQGCVFPEGWESSQAKPILQYDLDGNFIKEYSSINKAERSVKAYIRLCLKNKFSSLAGGYLWRYKNGDIKLKIPKYKYKQEHSIVCYDCNGDFYKEFPSISQAAKELHLHIGNISRAVIGNTRSCNGFFFKLKTTENYPSHINETLRLHKNQQKVEIEDLETGELYTFMSLRLIPKTLLSRCSLLPYIKKGIKEFIFHRNVTKKTFKIKITNYN